MKKRYPLLSTINELKDFKNLPIEKYPELIREIREYIIEVVSKNGGHLASNLGVVELTLAIHAVFDSPKDKIIWDVGHQCYTHKILTGRMSSFPTLRNFGGISGFPKTVESPHDVCETGHASTSISAALGMLAAGDLAGSDGRVVAVIGDGALTGGMAFEALNHAGHLQKNLIIILNDNNMSISKNVGALSVYLSKLSANISYHHLRDSIYWSLSRVPVLGKIIIQFIRRLKKSMKAFLFTTNIFTDFGFEYVGPVDGHNVSELIHILKKIRKLGQPVVLHVSTFKGKGYAHAEFNPVQFHGIGAFSIIDGKVEKKDTITFTQAFSRIMTTAGEKDDKVVAVSAAMTHGTGLDAFQAMFPDRFFDVGICEQHAVTFAAGLARGGLKPVVSIYSTFMQRAVDQVIHDVALPGLPVVFCMDRTGPVGADGETHHGVFDIALFRCIPGITIMSPSDYYEMEACLEYALNAKKPVILRYPRGTCPAQLSACSQPLKTGEGVFIEQGDNEVLLVATGSMLKTALDAAKILRKKNIFCDVYSLRFIKPIDEENLEQIVLPYHHVFIVEDGVLKGGVGEYLLSVFSRVSPKVTIEAMGVPDTFLPHGTREELFSLCGLGKNDIALKVESSLIRRKAFTLVKHAQ